MAENINKTNKKYVKMMAEIIQRTEKVFKTS